MIDLFQKATGAIATRLGALTDFQYTPVFIDRPRRYFVDTLAPDGVTTIPAGTVVDTPTIQGQINQALGGMFLKNGKCGTSIIVFQPSLSDRDHLSRVPAERFRYDIRVIENVLFNNGPSGTALSAELLAHLVKRHLQGWAPCAGLKLLPVEAGAITPILLDDAGNESNVCYDVRMYSNFVGSPMTRVERPDLRCVRDDQNPGNWIGDFQIECATAGAAIYYTLDGSFPIAANSKAILYAPEQAPYKIDAGTFISCAAYADGLDPSDVVEMLFN